MADRGEGHLASVPAPSTYEPCRDGRFEYAHDAIAHLERTSCGKGLGCAFAGRRADVREFGPGGTCPFLAGIFAGEVQPEIVDHGDHLACTAYREREFRRRGPRVPVGQGTLL